MDFGFSIASNRKRKKELKKANSSAEGLDWREKAKSYLPGPNHMQLLGSSIFDVVLVFRIRPPIITAKTNRH